MNPLHRALGSLLGLVFGASSAAFAVVITTGDGSGNTTPPPDDPGFANVGTTPSQLSGVYLGDRWALTAHHVGEVDLRFGGVTYPVIPGSRVQLMTGDVGADLALLRLESAPPLPAPVLATQPLASGEVASFVGSGHGRQPDLFCWDAAFLEVRCALPSTHRGYKRQGGARVVRWGRNAIASVDQLGAVNGWTTRYFTTVFDEAGLPHESHAVVGDSGGGVFLKRDGRWELVGLMFARFLRPGQPEDTAVFGNVGVHGDLYAYRQQILDVMDAPPVVPALPVGFWGTTALLLLAAALRTLPRD